MKKHFILVKGECGTCVAVDILSDGSSNEISSLTEQGFFIVYENCFAKDTSHAVSVWRSQENGLYPYDEILTSTTNLLGKVRTSIPRTKNENFSHLISMGYQ